MSEVLASITLLAALIVMAFIVERRWPREPRRLIVFVGVAGTVVAFALGAFVPAARVQLLGLVATAIAAVASGWLALTLWPNDESRRRLLVFAVLLAAIVGFRVLSG